MNLVVSFLGAQSAATCGTLKGGKFQDMAYLD
jgi:hypothetical protein